MSIISVNSLCKNFQLQKRKSGLWGSLTSLFSPEYTVKTALDHISFKIDEGELVGYIGPIWFFLFVVAGKKLLARSVKQFVIQGG